MFSRMFNDTSNNIQLHTTPHTTTRQHTTTLNVVFVRTSHAKSFFSSSTQCPKVAPRWSQDGPAWLKMSLRWLTIVCHRAFKHCKKQMVLEHRRLHTTNNNTQLHTTPHTTTRQHTIALKVIFVRTSHVKSSFPNPTKCFKVAPRWSQDGPTWSRWPQDAPPWCMLGLSDTAKNNCF